jgi:hypothetical protein
LGALTSGGTYLPCSRKVAALCMFIMAVMPAAHGDGVLVSWRRVTAGVQLRITGHFTMGRLT